MFQQNLGNVEVKVSRSYQGKQQKYRNKTISTSDHFLKTRFQIRIKIIRFVALRITSIILTEF